MQIYLSEGYMAAARAHIRLRRIKLLIQGCVPVFELSAADAAGLLSFLICKHKGLSPAPATTRNSGVFKLCQAATPERR
jgi:hypothetical protein